MCSNNWENALKYLSYLQVVFDDDYHPACTPVPIAAGNVEGPVIDKPPACQNADKEVRIILSLDPNV